MSGAKVLKKEDVHRGWATYSVITFRTPTGAEIRRDVEDHGRACCVLTYDPEKKVALLVRQFRASVFLASGEEHLTEVIAGVVDEDDPLEAAKREAMEEAGLRLDHIERVAVAWSMPGISTEHMYMYLAAFRAEDRVAKGGGLTQESEDIEVVEVPLRELAERADKGEIDDVKTFALVQTLRLRRPELFKI